MRSTCRRSSRSESGRIGTILIAFVVLVVAAGGAAYWFLIREDAKPKPKLANTKVVAGGTLDGSWKISTTNADATFVQYRIGETLASGLVDNTATGKSTEVTGSLTINGTEVSDISVTANMAALKSDKSFRDTALQSRGLETDTFKDATFAATKPVTLATAPAKGATVSVDVTGDLTLHGVTKSVTIPLQGRWDGKQVQVIGELDIVLADYGITAPSGGQIARIDDSGTLELQLTFDKAS
ncbi:MAG: YceI family protein [Acidimicrobiia bacterium]|nr:YceI family protein [Acidimicrobiia bacterium]